MITVVAVAIVAAALAVAFIRIRGAIHAREWNRAHDANRPSFTDHPIAGDRKPRTVTYHPCGCRTAYTRGTGQLVWLRNCDAHLDSALKATCRSGDGELA